MTWSSRYDCDAFGGQAVRQGVQLACMDSKIVIVVKLMADGALKA
jgi:hypothetical protein